MNETRFLLGDGVVMTVESWDQISAEARQEIRKLALGMVASLRPYKVTLVQIGPQANLRGRERWEAEC